MKRYIRSAKTPRSHNLTFADLYNYEDQLFDHIESDFGLKVKDVVRRSESDSAEFRFNMYSGRKYIAKCRIGLYLPHSNPIHVVFDYERDKQFNSFDAATQYIDDMLSSYSE